MSYIGQEPGLGQAQRSIFTAVAVTDTVTADDDGLPLNYTVGQVSVYLNGVKQVVGTDVTCANGSTCVFDSDYAIGDVIEVIALSTFSPADTVPASGGTFSGNVIHSGTVTNSGAVTNSTTTTLTGVATFNSDIKAGTIKANDGTAAITIADSTGVVTIADLTVSGTETILNTQTVEVEDNILQLNTTQASPDTATAATSGISVYRGDGVALASLIFDDADDTWDITNNLKVAGSIQSGDLILNSLDSTDGNEVDGTRGHWCIQEGDSDLFIINRVTNKKYKFKLEEIT